MASDRWARVIARLGLRAVAPIFLALSLCAACRAENNCPWLNEATAGGLLGGDAVGTFTAPSQRQPAVCTFLSKDASVTRSLIITVRQTPDFKSEFRSATQSCGPDAAPIQAIGNQAIVCIQDNRKGGLGQLVVGQVRDQIFTINLGTDQKGDILLTRRELKTRIYTAAEQVSGNLF